MERILFVVKAREFGGLEIVLLDWLSQVDYSRVSIAVCSYGTDTLRQKLSSLGPQVEIIPLNISDDAPIWKALPAWRRLVSSTRSDKIVFLEAMVGDFGVLPVFAAWRLNPGRVYLFEANWGRATPLEAQKRKLHFGFLPGIGWHRHKETIRQKLRAKFACHTFVVSQEIKENLVACYGYPAARTSVLYHGVNVSRYRPSFTDRIAFRRENDISEDATVIVSHGRIVPRKRIDRLLKAFELLYSEFPNLVLLLTSYGPFKDDVEKAVANSPASHGVKLAGFQEDPTRILKASDIYALSSNDEGFGIALVEALSTGLVCVATRGPGPKDIISDGENGFLVEPTEEGVHAGLRRALSLSPQERTQLVELARRTAETRFEINAAIRFALDAIQIPRK